MDTEESKSDPMVKDKKSLPMDVGFAIVPSFVFHVVVLVPILLFLLLPLALMSMIFNKVFAPKPSKVEVPRNDEYKNLSNTLIPLSQRKFDIVIFGATGFTGRLAALYVAKTYGTSIQWAICGR